MPALPEEQRQAAWAELMSQWSSDRRPCDLSKADLRAALDAIDDWANTNAASYNAALPPVARSRLTPGQKAELLHFVVRSRFREGV
jgi:hypothetical protein